MNGLFTRLAREARGQPRNPVRAAKPTRFQQGEEMAPAESIATRSGVIADGVEKRPHAPAESTPQRGGAPADAPRNASSAVNADRPRNQSRSEPPGGEPAEPSPLMPAVEREPPVTRQREGRLTPANEIVRASTELAASSDKVTAVDNDIANNEIEDNNSADHITGNHEYQAGDDAQTVAVVSVAQRVTREKSPATEPPEPLMPAWG